MTQNGLNFIFHFGKVIYLNISHEALISQKFNGHFTESTPPKKENSQDMNVKKFVLYNFELASLLQYLIEVLFVNIIHTACEQLVR